MPRLQFSHQHSSVLQMSYQRPSTSNRSQISRVCASISSRYPPLGHMNFHDTAGFGSSGLAAKS
jgi:hypothetical protein